MFMSCPLYTHLRELFGYITKLVKKKKKKNYSVLKAKKKLMVCPFDGFLKIVASYWLDYYSLNDLLCLN